MRGVRENCHKTPSWPSHRAVNCCFIALCSVCPTGAFLAVRSRTLCQRVLPHERKEEDVHGRYLGGRSKERRGRRASGIDASSRRACCGSRSIGTVEAAPAAEALLPKRRPRRQSRPLLVAKSRAWRKCSQWPARIKVRRRRLLRSLPLRNRRTKPKVDKPAAKPAAPVAAGAAVRDTSSILAAASAAAKPGPVSKSEAAARLKPTAPAKPAKGEVVAPPMPAKPDYAKPKPAN